MKKLIVLSLGLMLLQGAWAKGHVRLVHNTCEVSIDATYTNDGLNTFLSRAASNALTKKGFKMVEADAVPGAMAIKVDLKTEFNDQRGTCKAILSLRGTQDEAMSAMLLANVVKKKGPVQSVAGKCIKGVIKAIKSYPKCSTVLDPDTQQDPPDEPDTPLNDDVAKLR